MKKLFLSITFALTFPMCTHAQWFVSKTEADELKGTPAITNYYFNSESGAFCYFIETGMFSVGTKNGIFNTEYASSVGERGTSIIIGLYNIDHSIKEKITMWLDSSSGSYNILHTRNAGTMNNPVGQKKKIKKIYEHLTTTDGYIRIIAPIYGKADLDMIVPHIADVIKE